MIRKLAERKSVVIIAWLLICALFIPLRAASSKLSDLAAVTSVAGANLLYLSVGGVSKQITFANFLPDVAFAVDKNGTNQTGITNNTSTVVTWSTERVDTANAFASNVFTAPIAGNYSICAGIVLLTTTTTNIYYYDLYKNGAPGTGTALKEMAVYAAVTDADSAAQCWQIKLAVNDTLQLAIYGSVTASTVTVGGSALYTYFEGTLVHQ